MLPGTVVSGTGAGEPYVIVESQGLQLRAYDPIGLKPGEPVLAFARPENIEVLSNGAGRDEPGVLESTLEQISFEGPTVRFTVDVNGVSLKVSLSGLERLELLGAQGRRLRLRLGEVSLIRAAPTTSSDMTT